MTDYACRICGGRDAETMASRIRDWEYGASGEYEQRRCRGCGVAQLHPFPSLDELKRAYEVDYHGYAAASSKGVLYSLLFALHNARFERGIRRLLPPGSRVLDVGCGSGELLSKLRNIGLNDLHGIDFSPKAVAMAAERGIKIFQGIFADFQSEPSAFDAIFMNNYLEHTLDPMAELERAATLLRPGGLLIGEVPNFKSIDRLLFGRFWGGNHVPRHTYQFDRASLGRLLQRTGFTEAKFTFPVNTSHAALSVQNLLQRGCVNLANNPGLSYGRAWYYGLLLLGLIPINLPFALAGRGGLLDFHAKKT